MKLRKERDHPGSGGKDLERGHCYKGEWHVLRQYAPYLVAKSPAEGKGTQVAENDEDLAGNYD